MIKNYYVVLRICWIEASKKERQSKELCGKLMELPVEMRFSLAFSSGSSTLGTQF